MEQDRRSREDRREGDRRKIVMAFDELSSDFKKERRVKDRRSGQNRRKVQGKKDLYESWFYGSVHNTGRVGKQSSSVD